MTKRTAAPERERFPATGLGRLPPRFTTFVGREGELEALGRLIDTNRLVTLTGTGGTGKTSLAIELARARVAELPDGLWFVPLETIRDPSLVPATIAAAFRLPGFGTEGPAERLGQFLAGRRTLLILDNFEQVLPAALFVGELLRAADDLTVVVTSRAPLHLAAEQEYPVPTLAVPAPGEAPIQVLQRSSVRLYLERARRVQPDYEPTPADAMAVADICRRLDGIPLGIELAASRAALLPPRAIADRLADQVDLPGPATRDLPDRQRTLEATVRWSYDLLEEPERRLLARLSVFEAGFDLDQAEAVCGPGDAIGRDILEGLSRLAEQGLVASVPSDERARFRLLEPIRIFAGRCLGEDDAAPEIRRRHARAYLDLAERAAPNLLGRGQAAWLARLTLERDNLRAAVDWAIDHGDTDTALRLAVALWRFWQMRAHLDEGIAAITAVLDLPGADTPTTLRVRALGAAGSLHYWRFDPSTARELFLAELGLAEAIDDDRGAADGHYNLSFLAGAALDFASAIGHLAEASRLYAITGDERSLARVLWVQASLEQFSGRTEEARALHVQALERFRAFGDDYHAALAIEALSWTSLQRGDLEEAAARSLQALRAWRDLGDIAATINSLETASLCLQAAGLPLPAATVRAAFDALRRRYGVQPPAPLAELMSTHRPPSPAESPARSDAIARGAAMTVEEAADFAIGALDQRLGRAAGAGDPVDASTPEPSDAPSVLDAFVREGDVWTITFDGRTTRLHDAKGLGYLARLLSEPGREIAAIDLVVGPGAARSAAERAGVAELGLAPADGTGDPLVDAEARAAYRARLVDLQSDINDAERLGDMSRVSHLREEFEFIAHELAAATGLGQRPRGAASPAERARQSVTKAIRDSLDRIERHDRALGAHLRLTVRTGALCAYRPDPRSPVRWVTGSAIHAR